MNDKELAQKLADGILDIDQFDKEVKKTSEQIYKIYNDARIQLIRTFQAFMTAHETIRFYTDEDHYPVEVQYVSEYDYYDSGIKNVTIASIELINNDVAIVTDDDDSISLDDLLTSDIFNLLDEAIQALKYQDEIEDQDEDLEDEDE